MTEYAKSFGAKGLAYIKVENGEWKSPIVKFFSETEKASLTAKLKIEEGDLILFAADQWLAACEILGKIRIYCAEVLRGRGKLVIDPNRFDFLWVVDFPLMAFDKEQNRWYSSHHPFTAPVAEDIPLLATDPKKVRGQHYDIVVNGVELGGGSIRIHQPEVQKLVFEQVLQIPPDLVKARFGYMLEAFRYGAPPHGGIALGFDRLMAILCGTPSIRDVIAFPKTAKGTDLMTDSPAAVEARQLRDLYLEIKVKPAAIEWNLLCLIWAFLNPEFPQSRTTSGLAKESGLSEVETLRYLEQLKQNGQVRQVSLDADNGTWWAMTPEGRKMSAELEPQLRKVNRGYTRSV
jgi:aspartyl-tRNA synthetase